MDEAVRAILMYGLVPLWILAGIGDWVCHRRTHIECNAGIVESAMHSVMMVEVGVPTLLALFLEINALLFAVMILAAVIHAMTAWVDVWYASARRDIFPVEQHMHSLLEVLPLAAVALVASAYWDEFLALFGVGAVAPDFSLRAKADPLPTQYVATLLVVLVFFVAAPYAEELLRCVRARHRRVADRQKTAGRGR